MADEAQEGPKVVPKDRSIEKAISDLTVSRRCVDLFEFARFYVRVLSCAFSTGIDEQVARLPRHCLFEYC
jgi:hypothetical protein